MEDVEDLMDGESAAESAEDAADLPDGGEKQPGLFRKSAIILMVLVGGGTGGATWWFKDSMARDALVGTAATMSLEVADELDVQVKPFDGRLTATTFIGHQGDPAQAVLRWEDATVDLDILSLLGFGSELAIDRLALTGVSGSLRRKADGGLPVVDDVETTATPEDVPPDDATARDWRGDYERIRVWYQRYRSWRGEEAAATAEAEPIAEPAFNWPAATQFSPPPSPESTRRWLIRELAVSGGGFGLPDESPLDVTSFSLSGMNLTNMLQADEEMVLRCEFAVAAGGDPVSAILQQTLAGGSITVRWPSFPASVLQDERIGSEVAAFAPQGGVPVDLTLRWQGDDLSGSELRVDISTLRFSPPAGADGFVTVLAQAMAENQVTPMYWTIGIGGTLDRPRITDLGFDALVKQLTAGLKDQLAAKLRGELDQRLSAVKADAQAAVDDAKAEAEARLAAEQAKLEAEKRKLQEQAEAEKRKLQEQAEAEKRKLQEQAEAERQRLEEEKRKREEELKRKAEAEAEKATDKVKDALGDSVNKWLK